MVQELERYFAAEGEAERHPGLGKAIGVPGEDDGDRRRRRRMHVVPTSIRVDWVLSFVSGASFRLFYIFLFSLFFFFLLKEWMIEKEEQKEKYICNYFLGIFLKQTKFLFLFF